MKLFRPQADIETILSRCQVGGARLAQEGVHDGHEIGAVIPDSTWRELTPAEARDLCGEADVRRQVRIVTFQDTPELTSESLQAFTQGAQFLGQVRKEGGTLTTTVNREVELYLGLHVDNWDRLPASARAEARPRMMVNLGPGPRWLLVACGMDGADALREVDPDAYATDRAPHTDFVRTLVGSGRRLDLLRVLVAPGEGYIVPTELYIHDGSLEGLEEPSTGAFWLGHFPDNTLQRIL